MNPIQISTDELAAPVQIAESGAVVAQKKEDPPNPVLPVWNEIVWSAIFFLLFWALMKFVLLPPIRSIQKRREEQLGETKDSIDNAAKEKQDLISGNAEAMASVRSEASQIIEEARKRAEDYRAEIVLGAEGEISRFRGENDAKLDEAKKQALAGMKEDMGNLAKKAATLILESEPDERLVTAHIEKAEEAKGT